MAVYLILAICVAFFWALLSADKIKTMTFLILSFGLMALVLGCRGANVGEDTAGYLEIASLSQHMSWEQIFSNFPLSTFAYDQWGYPRQTETIFLALNKVIVEMTNNSQCVLMICAVVTCLGFGRFIYQNSHDIGQSTWLFLCDSMFMFGFNGMRQLMAMALALQFYGCFKCGRYIQGILWIAIATLFHTSCFVYFGLAVVYFICKAARGYRVVLVCSFVWPAIISVIGAVVSALFPRYALYFQVSYWNASLGGFVVVLAILCLMIFLALAQKDKDQEERYLVVNAVLYLTLEIVSQRLTTLTRIALMPRSYLMLFYPRTLEYIDKHARTLIFMALNGALLLLYLAAAASPARNYLPFWN